MKNANIFVDVDLTLIDANGKMLPGADEALEKFKAKGCHLFLWSTNGAEYSRKTAERLGLDSFFEGFAAKPDIIIDDMPATALNPFVFNTSSNFYWPTLADEIIRKHVD